MGGAGDARGTFTSTSTVTFTHKNSSMNVTE
jgi:hypothetical protein